MLNFFENSFRNTIRVFNSLNPDQDKHSDLGPICLQRLLADDKSLVAMKALNSESVC